MFESALKYADLPARALMSAVFVLSGISKIGAYGATQGYMEAFGVPGFLLAPTIAFEIVAGLMLLTGAWTRPVAFVLSGFTIITALVFHTDFSDQFQQFTFLKNMSMAGGLLLLTKTGAPGFSVDAYRSSKKGE